MTTSTTSAGVADGLAPYSGPLDRAAAWHLLRRCTFAPSLAEAADVEEMGLAAALDRLFAPIATPEPVNFDSDEDPNVAIGETWVRAPYIDGAELRQYRTRSLHAWLVQVFHEGGASLTPRMHFFWLNHFGVTKNGSDPRAHYDYQRLLRDYALGNFKALVTEMTVHPEMLIFLNGNKNRAASPNENYARELLELFTVGKGPLVGPGDYTNYTEDDIRALARSLTGWRVRNLYSKDPALLPESYFTPSLKDEDEKRLSERFGGALLAGSGEAEYKAVVDVIFAQSHVGDYLCRKLYRYFVYYEITAEVERTVIQPMSRALRESGFDVTAPLRLLLGSEHFFAERFRGALIRSPLEHQANLARVLGLSGPRDVFHDHYRYLRLNWDMERQAMKLFEVPTVAGWKAYYQAPQFNRVWINAATLQERTRFSEQLIDRGYFVNGRQTRITVDLLRLIEGFDNPTDPNDLIAEFGERLLVKPLDDEQVAALKDVLIPGLPDYEWPIEYGDYLDNPGDDMIRGGVERKLRALVKAMVTTAEIHLY